MGRRKIFYMRLQAAIIASLLSISSSAADSDAARVIERFTHVEEATLAKTVSCTSNTNHAAGGNGVIADVKFQDSTIAVGSPLVVTLDLNKKDQIDVTIISILGKTLSKKSMTVDGGKPILTLEETSKLQPGVYMARFNSSEGAGVAKKFTVH